MANYKEFILELQMNFGPHNPIRDVEHQLNHLTMKDSQCINKYILKFNWITMQVQSYGEVSSGITFITVSLIISKMRSPTLESLPLSLSSTHWHNQLICTIRSTSPRSTTRQSLLLLLPPSLTKLPPHPPQTQVVPRSLLKSRERPPLSPSPLLSLTSC